MRNTIKNEAFGNHVDYEADIDDAFVPAPYIIGLRAEGFPVDRYTSGDTRYQATKPLTHHFLTTLPSKVSKRYSPQTPEQNTGMPLPPEPSFMKSNSQFERIVSIRDIGKKKIADTTSHTLPLIEGNFARTHADAAALLERLGAPISYEAHNSAPGNRVEHKQDSISESDRIIVSGRTTHQKDYDDQSRIVLNSIPTKTYDNLNLVAIGQEANMINTRQADRGKTFIATRTAKKIDSVDGNSVFNNIGEEDDTPVLNSRQSQNILTLIENKLVNTPGVDEIKNAADAPKVIRKVVEEFVQMKNNNNREQNMQMKTVENRIKKTILSELPEEIDTKMEAVNEITEIIREVVASHPNIVQRNTSGGDMEFTLAARDAYLRVQIEEELREKFDLRLIENNKLLEKHSRVVFEEMIDRFLNP